MRAPAALIATASSLAVSASLLAVIPAASAADGPTTWTDPAVVTTGTTVLYVADTDAQDDLSVSVVKRFVGQNSEFDVYTARAGGAWVLQRTIAAATVGATTGMPRIATDGSGWAVTWPRRIASSARWDVVVASSASVNTAPTIAVLNTDFSDGYVSAPEVSIDGTPNDSLTTGPRYLVGWLAATGLGTHVRVSEMHQQRSWSASRLIQAYQPVSTLSAVKVAYAADRSAGIGYVNTINTTGLVTFASRAAAGTWTPGQTLVDLSFAPTSGAWDLDMPETATHASVALANATGSAVKYAWMRLGTGVPAAQDSIATSTGTQSVGSLVVSDRRSAKAVVAWTEQDAAPTVTVQPYRIMSYVTDLQESGVSGEGRLVSGRSSGTPGLQIGMNDDGRVWLASTELSEPSVSNISVYAAGPAAAPTFWTGASVAEITTGITQRGTGLLVPGSASVYPRMIWAQSSGTTYSVLGSQEVPADGQAPGAPTGVFAIPGDGEATVRWTAPADPGSSAITAYTVTAFPGGATCTSATRECTVTGLTNGTSYAFTVTAANLSGEGPPSAPSEAITPGPVAPALVKVRPKDNGRIVVRWPASTSPAVTGYILRVKKGGGSWQRTDVGADRRHSYTVRVGQRLCAQVASVNAAGDQGPWTPRVCARGRR